MAYISANYITISDHGDDAKVLLDVTSFSVTETNDLETVKTINPSRRAQGYQSGVHTFELALETKIRPVPEVDWRALLRTETEFTLQWQESSAADLFDGQTYVAISVRVSNVENSVDADGAAALSVSLMALDIQEG